MKTLPPDAFWTLKMVMTPVQPEAGITAVLAEEVRQQVAARMPEILEKIRQALEADPRPVHLSELNATFSMTGHSVIPLEQLEEETPPWKPFGGTFADPVILFEDPPEGQPAEAEGTAA